LKGHTGSVSNAVFSPDGKHIVTASSDKTAIIWPTPEGIMDYLKTAPIPKLTPAEKKELGIDGFEIE
jgi:WD40 repeat protein